MLITGFWVLVDECSHMEHKWNINIPCLTQAIKSELSYLCIPMEGI